jgi:glycerol-3-phosphate dehydrogenase
MGSTFSSEQRSHDLDTINQQEFDLLIIGGGITGAGIALDAQTRGINTVLIEMQDFAAGTSSRSTKLVHGGLRYLKQFEVAMVAEVGKERAIVYENGPHVTTPEWMILPIYKGGTFGKLSTSFGLRVYDYLAGVKKKERRQMLNVEKTLAREPMLKKDGLRGSGCYVEYRTDDARLTLEVLKKAVEAGVKAVNYTKAVNLINKNKKLNGVQVRDQLTGQSYSIYAKKIVNAAGPWVDTLREQDNSKEGSTLHLTKGVHLVFDSRRLPLKNSVYFDTSDGRMTFAIPREGKTYVGTTDTTYNGNIAHPQMTVTDRDYILQAANGMFPTLNLTAADVESSWTGLRPLIHEEGKSASEISRKDEIFHSSSGLISIAGGKLTGYRKMAESIVNEVAKQLELVGGKTYPTSQTKYMPISGGDVGGSEQYPLYVEEKVAEGVKLGLSELDAEHLVRRYGSNIDMLYNMIPEYREQFEKHSLSMPLIISLEYSIQYEMAVKPTDFFIRRTGALFFDIDFVQMWKEKVIDYMASKLSWSEQEKEEYTSELNKELHDAVFPLET